jgi:predicted PurR-regulated permease PerM
MFIHRHHDEQKIQEVEVTVSNRTLIRVIFIILISIGLVQAFVSVERSILILFIAFFLALALNAPVAKIAGQLPGRIRGNRLVATSISYLMVVLVLTAFGFYAIPPFIHQTAKFISVAPNLVKATQNQHTSLGHFVRVHHLEDFINTLSKDISSQLKHIGGKAFSGITTAAEDIFYVLAVIVLTFMMLVEGPRWLSTLRELFFSKDEKKDVERIAGEIYKVVRGYVNGQVMLAFIAAVLIGPALFIMGVSYPIALMVIIFICGLIPLIGHTIGAIIVTSVALFHSLTAAIIVLIWYIIYVNFENYILQPRIQANTTKMSPLLVFAAIIVGINFDGIVGGLIAIPVAGSIRILVIEYLERRRVLPADYISDDTVK